MENIKDRLQDTVKTCAERYDQWSKNPKDTANRQNLEDAVHELRKVTSRIEIEMAISERSNSNMKPLPIPPHRASRPKTGQKQDNTNIEEKKTPTVSLNSRRDNAPSLENDDNDKPKKTLGRRPKLKTAAPKADDAE